VAGDDVSTKKSPKLAKKKANCNINFIAVANPSKSEFWKQSASSY
jgi:hypothetical protein